MKKIIWLASYPKSGNTWFRIFLENLLQNKEQPVDINQLDNTPIASARWIFDEAVGIPAAELTLEEIDCLRPEVYRHLAGKAKEPLFLKIHDAYTILNNSSPLVPSDITRGVLYFIRNPLDVAVSFANHAGIPISESIERMNSNSYCFCENPGVLHNQLRQQLLSWSGHVLSWTTCKNIDLHLVRYEDMKTNPLDTFNQAIKFFGLNKSQAQIEKALEFSDIKELQRQENESGFREKSSKCGTFFNKGNIGYWREILTKEQTATIVNTHRNVMSKFGYLDQRGIPVF